MTVDLEDEAQVKRQVAALKPETIIHTAAMTDVDECQRNPLRAKQVNVQATKILARLELSIWEFNMPPVK